MDLARMETPRRGGRNKSDHEAGGGRRRKAAAADKASRGPATIAAPKSQFRTCPTDHGKAPSNIAPDPLGITDSAYKNQLVVVSVQYGPFNTYIPIRSTTIGKSRVARDPIAMHTSWRSNSDITSVTRVSMTFRVVRTNQYNQDLGLIHSTNGSHLESPNEGSLIDHQVTIYLHAQNITMFPTNETRCAVSTYVATNKTIDSRGETVEPGMAKVAIVRKKSVSKKKSAPTDADDEPVEVVAEKAGSRKRPAITVYEPVVKKKRTTSGIATPKAKDLAIVSVALDAVPIKTVEPTPAVPAVRPKKLRWTPLAETLQLDIAFGRFLEAGEVLEDISLL
ncbi:hypothetical protein F511_15246 [Dorcoceras hygrometricum]|uniref:Uncharacterized protein n=1 Tax=Dorcoceras hygrometricum TaxID=472368 RepID=A0A2Z7C004_9LAMI|nr:hypothetical protein F511_15246 [Dorcoceras hygrometricum]